MPTPQKPATKKSNRPWRNMIRISMIPKFYIILNISMGSGGYNYVAEKVYESEESLTFQLKQTTEGPVTADMSGIHILVEMDKSWDTNPQNIKIEYL